MDSQTHTHDSVARSNKARVHLDRGPYDANLTQSLDFGRLETRFLSIESVQPVRNLARKHKQNRRGAPFLVSSERGHGSDLYTSTEVSCELETKSLFECPEYTALSYSWGDHSSTRRILLDGHVKQVTASLGVALKELVARGIGVVWVDALCIDQKNQYEKVYQLRQIGTIFSKASKVIAWLGPAEESSDNAMQALSTMRRKDGVDQHGRAIVKLLKRQYWERVWIIQELAKASRVEVWCGTKMLTWDVFVEGIRTWWAHTKLRATDSQHPIFTLNKFCDAERNSDRGDARMLLCTAMVRTLHTKASLERDRLYALLGITRDGSETVPTPNYVQEDADVFSPILRHMIVKQDQLNLLFLAGLERNNGLSPSWLPIWDSRMRRRVSPWILECFGHPRDTNCPVDCQSDVLTVRGQLLGQVRTATEPLNYTIKFDEAIAFLDNVARQIWMCGNYTKMATNDLSETVLFRTRALAKFVYYSFPNEDYMRCASLRWWSVQYADVPFGDKTLRSCVEKVINIVTFRNEFFDCRSPPLESEEWLWLDKLDASVAAMLRHGVELRSLIHQGRSKLVVMSCNTQEDDIVARIGNCSLPIVLRNRRSDDYVVVGEVVEVPRWIPSSGLRHSRSGQGLSSGKVVFKWAELSSFEWRTFDIA
jgi:hypothetical protein